MAGHIKRSGRDKERGEEKVNTETGERLRGQERVSERKDRDRTQE